MSLLVSTISPGRSFASLSSSRVRVAAPISTHCPKPAYSRMATRSYRPSGQAPSSTKEGGMPTNDEIRRVAFENNEVVGGFSLPCTRVAVGLKRRALALFRLPERRTTLSVSFLHCFTVSTLSSNLPFS